MCDAPPSMLAIVSSGPPALSSITPPASPPQPLSALPLHRAGPRAIAQGSMRLCTHACMMHACRGHAKRQRSRSREQLCSINSSPHPPARILGPAGCTPDTHPWPPPAPHARCQPPPPHTPRLAAACRSCGSSCSPWPSACGTNIGWVQCHRVRSGSVTRITLSGSTVPTHSTTSPHGRGAHSAHMRTESPSACSGSHVQRTGG